MTVPDSKRPAIEYFAVAGDGAGVGVGDCATVPGPVFEDLAGDGAGDGDCVTGPVTPVFEDFTGDGDCVAGVGAGVGVGAGDCAGDGDFSDHGDCVITGPEGLAGNGDCVTVPGFLGRIGDP